MFISLPQIMLIYSNLFALSPLHFSVMIALGDLAFRFPNSIEPWTPRMYSR